MDSKPVKVLLFGPAREFFDGRPDVVVHVNHADCTVATLRKTLHDEYPPIRKLLGTSIFAVERKMVPIKDEGNRRLDLDNVEVVLVPPVSGG